MEGGGVIHTLHYYTVPTTVFGGLGRCKISMLRVVRSVRHVGNKNYIFQASVRRNSNFIGGIFTVMKATYPSVYVPCRREINLRNKMKRILGG